MGKQIRLMKVGTKKQMFTMAANRTVSVNECILLSQQVILQQLFKPCLEIALSQSTIAFSVEN